MKRLHLLAICALLAAPAHGQYAVPQPDPSVDWSRGQYTPPSSTSTIPILQTIPDAPVTKPPAATIQAAPTFSAVPPPGEPLSGMGHRVGILRSIGEHGTNAGTALGEIGASPARTMDRVGAGAGIVQHTLGAAGAYRQGGAEGMQIYLGDAVLDEAKSGLGEGAAALYYSYKTGRTITTAASGAAGLAFTTGTFIGDWIKTQKHWMYDGKTLETHVTNLWYHNLQGREDQRRYDEITSDEAIERHRQMLRQQRFSSINSANEQAAANRAALAAQSSAAADNAAFMNEFMLTIMPAAIAASRQRSIQPPPASPSPARDIPHDDGIKILPACGTVGIGIPCMPQSPALGSTFGTNRRQSGGYAASSETRPCLPPHCYDTSKELGPGW